MTLFVNRHVLLTLLQTSLLYWRLLVKCFLGLRGIFCCNTISGHRAKLEARLSGAIVSRYE